VIKCVAFYIHLEKHIFEQYFLAILNSPDDCKSFIIIDYLIKTSDFNSTSFILYLIKPENKILHIYYNYSDVDQNMTHTTSCKQPL